MCTLLVRTVHSIVDSVAFKFLTEIDGKQQNFPIYDIKKK